MRHGACKAQGDGGTKQEGPGFGVKDLAAKLKRQISHAKFTAHQTPPPPLYDDAIDSASPSLTLSTSLNCYSQVLAS